MKQNLSLKIRNKIAKKCQNLPTSTSTPTLTTGGRSKHWLAFYDQGEPAVSYK